MNQVISRGLIAATLLALMLGTVHAEAFLVDASPGLGTLFFDWLFSFFIG